MALEATENSLTRTSMHIKLESMVKSLEECLSVMFGVKASHTRREQLVPIFEEAVKFSRILGAQRASYSILMLNQKMKNDRAFDDEAMEDVDVESGYTPTQIGKQVKFVIFPALIKEVTQDEVCYSIFWFTSILIDGFSLFNRKPGVVFSFQRPRSCAEPIIETSMSRSLEADEITEKEDSCGRLMYALILSNASDNRKRLPRL